jgi:D-sedoheptulose 7-phosphate isomerase
LSFAVGASKAFRNNGFTVRNVTSAGPFLGAYVAELHRLTKLTPELVRNVEATRTLWLAARDTGGKVIFVGNGGSAAIAAHLAVDLAKNARLPATCFNDGAQITCLANDYGFENWIAQAVRQSAMAHDVLVAISASGRSANILNGVAAAREIGAKVVTLSGMHPDNPLRQHGDVRFWADSMAYNIIETVHQFWMMSVIDLIIGRSDYPAN